MKPRFEMDGKILVPRLRFSGFEGGWDDSPLRTKMDIFRGASPRPKGDVRYYGGSIPRLMIEDVTRDGKYAFPKIDFLTEEGAQKSRFVKKGNVVLSCSGTRVAIPGILGVDACIHDGFLSFRNLKDIDKEYLYYTFVKLHEEMQKEATTGGVFNNLTTEIAKSLKIGFPSLQEQQKIAAFLTVVDQHIQSLQKKHLLLAQYKEAMLQKLFSQEARFKDDQGKDFPDWVTKKLAALYSFKFTNSYSRDKLNYREGSVKNIHYGDIHTKFKTHLNLLKEKVPFINMDLNLTRIKDENFIQDGDLLVADASEDYEDIGKAVEVVNLNNEKVLGGLHTFLLRRNDDFIAIGFGGHLMREYQLRLNIKKIAQGTKVLSISSGRLSKISVKLPSLKEQQKIASFLSTIDEAIEKVGLQVAQMQEFKKGLLQKMFV